MSVAPIRTLNAPAASRTAIQSPSRRWILNSWLDLVLFVGTPLLILPLVFVLKSPWIGIEVETISLIVVAFGALGHHFPGMIRAYCDRELFQRFRLRFILVPPLLFAIFFPLFEFQPTVMKAIIAVWACWHGLMQVYGFVRIYDAKVGCVSAVTAYWDWLMCLCWFSTAQVFSSGNMPKLLEYWYSLGGPLIPPASFHLFRWVCLSISMAVLVGFLANYVIQFYRGPQPNPAKLLLLSSGIGCWWFAMVFIDNIVLGVAVFEIFHDVQYLASVWLYNCRRVNSSPDIGRFMRFMFRRGILMLYDGLVLAYGMIGLVPRFAQDGTLKTIFMGILWTSTVLHYYYDGFIWKVRETATRVSLGLNDGAISPRARQLTWSGLSHFLKWTPLIGLVGWVSISELSGSSVPASIKEERLRKYTQELSGSTKRPAGKDEQVWLYQQYERIQNIAAAFPENLGAQLRAAIILANFGRNDEAIAFLEKLLKQHPDFADGYQTLGEIQLYRGSLDKAASNFVIALSHAKTKIERANANLRLGEVHLRRKQFELATTKFREALKDNPRLDASIKDLGGENGSIPLSHP